MIIQTTPKLVSLAGNPMRYKFHQGTLDPGIKPKLTITFTAKDTTEDHIIDLVVMGELRQLVLKSSPSQDYEIPVATEGQTLGEWVSDVYDAIAAIPEVATYYDVVLNDESSTSDSSEGYYEIELTSKEEDPAYDIEVTEKDLITAITATAIPCVEGDPETASELQLAFTGKETSVDHYIELTVMGIDRRLITKSSPAASWEIPVATEEESTEEWCQRVKGQLSQTDYEPGALYDVTIDGVTIIITANEVNPYFDITVKNPITGVTAEAIEGELPAWDYSEAVAECEKAQLILSFYDIDETADHTIECTIMDVERIFTLKEDVGKEWELPVALPGETVDEWAQRVYDALCLHYVLSTYYDIELNLEASGSDSTSDYATITITAKEEGSDFDMSIEASNIIGISLDDTEVGYLPNWTYTGVVMQVRRDSATGELLGEEYKPFDSTDSATFDVAEYLYAELLGFTSRHFYNTLPSRLTHNYSDYVLSYFVSFYPRTANNEYGTKVSDIERYALGGGFSREMLVKNNLGVIDWFADANDEGNVPNHKKFLTWCPLIKYTDQSEHISLFYLIQWSIEWEHYEAQWVQIDVLMSNGNTVHLVPSFTPIQDEYSVMEINVGYPEILPYLTPYLTGGRTVVSWDVTLKVYTDAIESATETRTFILDTQYYEKTRYFRFRNSFGAYDSLLCTGKFEESVEHERTEATYINFADQEIDLNPERRHIKVTGTKSYKANTGFFTEDYLEYLNDFLLSREIYEYKDDQLQRILITSKKVSLAEDRNNLYYLSFEYEYASQNEFYSII